MKRTPLRAPQPDPARFIKNAIAGRVVALFNDRARGEAPIVRRVDGTFGPKAVAWRVHGDVTSMMVGGISSLLLQMLHPAVLAGVWDHSNFRTDMYGQLRRTARFIALMTYGERKEAKAVIARVRHIHDRVGGILPDGTPYAANAIEWIADQRAGRRTSCSGTNRMARLRTSGENLLAVFRVIARGVQDPSL